MGLGTCCRAVPAFTPLALPLQSSTGAQCPTNPNLATVQKEPGPALASQPSGSPVEQVKPRLEVLDFPLVGDAHHPRLVGAHLPTRDLHTHAWQLSVVQSTVKYARTTTPCAVPTLPGWRPSQVRVV